MNQIVRAKQPERLPLVLTRDEVRRRHIHETLAQRAVRAAARSTAIAKPVTPHALEGGYDIRAIQELLGHEDVTTTGLHPRAQSRPPRRPQHPRRSLSPTPTEDEPISASWNVIGTEGDLADTARGARLPAEPPLVAGCDCLGSRGPHEKRVGARGRFSMVQFDPQYKVGRTGSTTSGRLQRSAALAGFTRASRGQDPDPIQDSLHLRLAPQAEHLYRTTSRKARAAGRRDGSEEGGVRRVRN
jgi:hypothetical protein